MIKRSGVERRRQIAEAALEIVAESGLRGFTTATLARRVGLAEGTVFRHFSSKEEIVEAAIELTDEWLSRQFPPANVPPLEQLGRFFVERVRLIREKPGLFRILFSDQLAQAASDDGAERVRALKQRSVKFVRRCLEDASERGALRSGLDPGTLAFVVHGAALSLVFHGGSPDGGAFGPDPERVWRLLERLFRRDFGSPAGPSDSGRDECGGER